MPLCDICKGDDSLSDARIGNRFVKICRICAALIVRQEGLDIAKWIEIAKTIRGFVDTITIEKTQAIFSGLKETFVP